MPRRSSLVLLEPRHLRSTSQILKLSKRAPARPRSRQKQPVGPLRRRRGPGDFMVSHEAIQDWDRNLGSTPCSARPEIGPQPIDSFPPRKRPWDSCRIG
jgi:hypothetical protein